MYLSFTFYKGTKMSKKLQEYLSKVKKQNLHDHRFPKMDSFTFSVNHRKLARMFSGCKHPQKTLSFSIDQKYTLPRHKHNNEAPGMEEAERGEATLSDIDRFLVENFKSLYGNKYEDHDDDESNENHTHDDTDIEIDKSYLRDKSSNDSPLGDLCGSSATTMEDGAGCSSDSTTASYVNKSSQPLMCLGENDQLLPDECIAVLKRSSTLYDDFWNSMKEMIDARVENGASADGEFLQEMLLCFLNLNEKKYYRYIVSAFMNLTADLSQISDK